MTTCCMYVMQTCRHVETTPRRARRSMRPLATTTTRGTAAVRRVPSLTPAQKVVMGTRG